MAQGSKKKYTSKQKRKAKHIEDGAKKSGRSSKAAARIAWATVNKESGGGNKSGSGRGTPENKTASRKGGKKAGKKKAGKKKAGKKVSKKTSRARKAK